VRAGGDEKEVCAFLFGVCVCGSLRIGGVFGLVVVCGAVLRVV
jgi:hypothetical protein